MNLSNRSFLPGVNREPPSCLLLSEDQHTWRLIFCKSIVCYLLQAEFYRDCSLRRCHGHCHLQISNLYVIYDSRGQSIFYWTACSFHCRWSEGTLSPWVQDNWFHKACGITSIVSFLEIQVVIYCTHLVRWVHNLCQDFYMNCKVSHSLKGQLLLGQEMQIFLLINTMHPESSQCKFILL